MAELDKSVGGVAVTPVEPKSGNGSAEGRPSPAGVSTGISPRGTATVVPRRPGREESDPRRSRIVRRRIELALGISVPILLLAGWELASRTGALDRQFFPAPSDLWSTGVNLYSSGQIERLLGTSFRRVFEGFFAGSAAGLLLGVVIGSSRIVRAALEPLVYALWTIPKLALLPLLLLFFGLGETSVIVLIGIECMFLVLIPTITAIVSVPVPYCEAATSFGASRWQMLRYVTLPAALPQMFVALRLSAGASVLVMVAAEYVDGKTGIGFFIFQSWQLYATKQMYIGILTVAVAGAAFTLVVSAIGRYLTRWQRV
jgi:NitT/TauT family transport system permease protein/sulfonate transport system permease protein